MNRKALYRILIYAAVFIFFTLIFLVINYPSEKLTDQVNAWILPASNGTLAAGNSRFKPLLSMEVSEITLELDHGSLGLGDAVVRPHIFKMLTGKMAADVNFSNPWLNSNFSAVSSGESLDLVMPDAVVDLSRLPEDIFPLPLELNGKIEISMELFSKDLSREISNGDARMISGPISVGGDLLKTLGFDPLKIARVSAVATVQDNVVTLGENTVEGDLNAIARGVIRLSPLAVELTPDSESRERLKPIFALMGARTRSDGSINLRIRGTMGRPSITM